MTFKIATIVPDGTDWMATMRSGSKEIEQRTEGRVKIKLYGGGIQGSDAQVRRKMRIGQLHGGVFTSGGLREFHKNAEIYGLPMLFRDYDEVAYVRERLDDRVHQMLEEAGYVNFGIAGGGFAYLVSNTAIGSRQDMRGLKVWIPEGDQVAQNASRALGIAPVTLPLTDVLTGLQTDLIDTVMGPPVGVIVMQWHTAMNYITNLPLAYAFAALIIDARAFGRISEQDQRVVREVMERIYRGFNEQGIVDDRNAYQALLDEGLQPVELTAQERAGWQELISRSNREVAEKGIYDLALLKEIECYLTAYRTGSDATHCSP